MGPIQLSFKTELDLAGIAGKPQYATIEPAMVRNPTIVVMSKPLFLEIRDLGQHGLYSRLMLLNILPIEEQGGESTYAVCAAVPESILERMRAITNMGMLPM